MQVLEVADATTAELSADDRPGFRREQVNGNQGGAATRFSDWRWIITIPAGTLRLVPDGRHLDLDTRDPLLGSVHALAEQLSGTATP